MENRQKQRATVREKYVYERPEVWLKGDANEYSWRVYGNIWEKWELELVSRDKKQQISTEGLDVGFCVEAMSICKSYRALFKVL